MKKGIEERPSILRVVFLALAGLVLGVILLPVLLVVFVIALLVTGCRRLFGVVRKPEKRMDADIFWLLLGAANPEGTALVGDPYDYVSAQGTSTDEILEAAVKEYLLERRNTGFYLTERGKRFIAEYRRWVKI